MPIEFTVVKTRQLLEKQWMYLVERSEANTAAKLKRLLVGMLLITGLYLFLYFFTAADDFIVVKGVGMLAIPLVWLYFMIIRLFVLSRERKHRKKLTLVLSSFNDEQLSYSVRITEEHIVTTFPTYTHEFLWTEFHRYGVHGETLYIAHTLDGIKSLFWDEGEIGKEPYTALLDLVQKKELKKVF